MRIAAVCLLVLGLMGGSLVACSENGPVVNVPTSLDALSLSGVWQETLEATEVQDSTASLKVLSLYADEAGSLDLLHFAFDGRNKRGEGKVYSVDVNSSGELHWYSYDADPGWERVHPKDVFSELDHVGLGNLERGNQGISISIDIVAGAVGYSSDYVDAYILDSGNLLPLREIVFHSNVPWASVWVSKRYSVETGSEDAGPTTVETLSTVPIPPEQRTSQVWFLSRDLDKAASVLYLQE
jgi:hypothetical protein